MMIMSHISVVSVVSIPHTNVLSGHKSGVLFHKCRLTHINVYTLPLTKFCIHLRYREIAMVQMIYTCSEMFSSTLCRKKFLRKPQDDSEPEPIEFHHYTHEVFFQSLARPRSESSQSGFVILTNHSDITEGNNTG